MSPLRKTAPYGRPVHRLGDRAGRSPGLRVSAFYSCPAFPVSQWPLDFGSPLTVAGAATDGFARSNVIDRKSRVPSFVSGVGRRTSTIKFSSWLSCGVKTRKKPKQNRPPLRDGRSSHSTLTQQNATLPTLS